MTPPPREGGGHCLAIRNGKAFRVCACVCVWETEWGAEKGWDKFSTTDRALERWAGETSSGIWDVHCHAFLNSWRICCPLHPHPFVSSFGRWKLGCCFVVVAKQGRWESCRDKCALFASTDQSVFWRHPYIISLLGRGRERERARERNSVQPGSYPPVLNWEARLTDRLALQPLSSVFPSPALLRPQQPWRCAGTVLPRDWRCYCRWFYGFSVMSAVCTELYQQPVSCSFQYFWNGLPGLFGWEWEWVRNKRSACGEKRQR